MVITKNFNLLINLLITGLIARTLDILAAIFIAAGGNVAGTFKFIARGVFGESAIKGGGEMIAWGAFFHYLIAMSWTAAYFLLYPKLSFLKWNKWFNAAAYGVIVWCGMNLIVIPLSQIAQRGFQLRNVIINILILMVCIGLPVALMADKFYAKNAK